MGACCLVYYICWAAILMHQVSPFRIFYMTEFCGGIARDVTSAGILYFHRDARPSSFVFPYEVDFRCEITLQAVEPGLGIYFKDFIVTDPLSAPGDCSSASLTVYLGPDTTAATSFQDCGTSFTPRAVEVTSSQSLTFVLHVDYSANILNPTVNDTVDNSTLPRVYFRVELTEFIPACNESRYGEPTYLKCTNSRRCVRRDQTACDNFGIANCRSPSSLGDTSDEDPAPGGCTTTTRTTTPTTTTVPTTTSGPPPDLTALWATVGSILGLAALIFLSWRPGYLPWRLSRMRNWPCCRSAYGRMSSSCFRYCSCCSQHATDSRNQLYSDDVTGDTAEAVFSADDINFPGGIAAPWMGLAVGDGAHLSENR